MPDELKDAPLPIPHYPSRRLVGFELELAAGSNGVWHKPLLTPGWHAKGDMSLTNGGEEYVLEPPLPLTEARQPVDEFSASAIKAGTYLAMKGGYHIHVQAHDVTHEDATRLVQLYWKYQEQINLICGKSRRTTPTPNRFATPFDESHMPTQEEVVEMFKLGYPAPTRSEAKTARIQAVVNLAMMRCTNALQRSIEFRQQSPSKKTVNIYGWACLTVGLVELARNERVCKRFIASRRPATWAGFLSMLRRIEKLFGASDLVAWAKWRREYLEAMPTQDQIHKMARKLIAKAHGLFYISRVMNVNTLVASRVIDTCRSKGILFEERPGAFRVKFSAVAEADVRQIAKLWQAQEQPVQAVAVPTPSHVTAERPQSVAP